LSKKKEMHLLTYYLYTSTLLYLVLFYFLTFLLTYLLIGSEGLSNRIAIALQSHCYRIAIALLSHT